MSKLTKNQKSVADKIEAGKIYTLNEASKLVKEITTTKFDASLDIDVRLGVDPRKANQMVRGVVSLPNGTGKTVRVLCLCTPDVEDAAKEAGADEVGADDLVEKVQNGYLDFDVVIATPMMMAKVGRLGRILGPKGLMPNPKTGTVTMDTAKAVKNVKAGQVEYRVDRQAAIHAAIGKVSFTEEQLTENFRALQNAILRAKPAAAKGQYIKSCAVAATFGPGIKLDPVALMG